MAHYAPSEETFTTLKDKVVVITGGSTGIGAATVKLLATAGATVVIGDVNKQAAEQLCQQHEGVSFAQCDVTKYDDIYDLFKTALEKHGRVDHAVSSAGIFGK
ncbi:uncharacterized protein LTR77_010477 [Saxophila tyrrhenica]|uniref:Alcohol dehydrogenase n=1 Tax=Saxophila tyrrhenica TaxID=1690608 RepID=A0AAV9NYW9_9PEZI|nr:hypothetical protein LTR77_010477 [Saxophila tyrrhenica]